MRKSLTLAAAGAIALAGCAQLGMPGLAVPTAGDMTPESRAAYLAMAASSDLYEIQSGQMAAQRAQNMSLRPFGQMLAAHHTQTTQQLAAAAQASGGMPPPLLLPMHQQMLAQLQSASGSGFDRLFVNQQVTAHEMALALHRNYASAGDTPALRQTAAAAVPIITQHLQQARQLS